MNILQEYKNFQYIWMRASENENECKNSLSEIVKNYEFVWKSKFEILVARNGIFR